MCFALSKFKNRNNLYVLFNKLIKVAFVCFAALLVLSCGGGGGGGGGSVVAFNDTSGYHNGGDAGGWGSAGGGSFSSGSSDGLLFEAFPPFFSPIDHIDMSLMVNGSPVELTGLNESTPSDVLDVSNGDQISGTAVITLADGTTRNATLSTTTIGLTNKLALVVEYKYKLIDSAPDSSSQVEGTYMFATGINVSSITWMRGSDPVEGWKTDSGTPYAAGGTINGIKGDIILTAFYPELYNYTLIDGAGNASNVTGTYTFASGIDVSSITWTADGTTTGTAVSDWKSDTGTVYSPDANGKITGIIGDIILTSRYPLGWDMSEGTLYRYGTGANLYTSTSIGVTGGSGNYTAVSSSDALIPTVSGSTVLVSVNSAYGSTAGQTVTGTDSASGAAITITISDDSGSARDVTIRLKDCVINDAAYGLMQNSNITASFTPSIPTNGIVNGDTIGSSISSSAFRGNAKISSLTLPSTITTISAGTMTGTHPYANAQGAFSGSSITTLTATGLRTIGNGAFTNSSISTINLSNVTSIGRYAFTGCTGLSSVNLSSVTTLSSSAFADCSTLSSVTWWGASGPSTIPERAFDGTALTSASFASFPSSVTTIGSKAFANTGITDLSWLCDTSVNTIADDAFEGCSLSELTVPGTITDITSVMPKFKNLGITDVSFSGLTTVGANTFKDFADLETITITGSELVMYAVPSGPDASRSKWASSSFANCSSLRTIDCTSCSEVHYTGGVLPSSGTFATSGVVKLGTSLSRLVLGACSVQPGLHFEYVGNSAALLPGGSVSTETYGGSSVSNGVKVHCQSDDVWLQWSDASLTWSVTTAP